MKKKNNIPTILGVIILLVGTFAGVFLLRMTQVFRIGADTSISPKDIRISNLSDTTATITWTTDKEASSFVNWGEGQSLGKIEKESLSDEKFFIHSVTLTGLKANTDYYYKINSGGSNFDNNGIPWQFTSGSTLGPENNSLLVSGSVISATGQPEKRVLVYINVGGYLLSTLTSDTGNFVFQLGGVRNQDLQSYAQIDPGQTLLEISVVAGADGVASAQIFPQSANPIPSMVLGQVYDFRNLQPTEGGTVPNANLSLPQNIEKISKFNIPLVIQTPTPTSVILESLSEGEIITSTKPAFFGRGPAGEEITITIQSDPITEILNISSNGTWTFSPPEDLSPGAHTVTVSWIDSTGITRTITRNFIVQASELPAFVATPSQTLAPTSTPTSSPLATLSPTPTAKPTGTPSAVPVPVTGSLTGTFLLSIMGVAVMLFSVAVWKISENA